MGGLGQGKTLTASLLSLSLRSLSKNKLNVYANYDLANAKRFNKLDELTKIKNSVIVYDEIYLDLDSRSWWRNEEILQFFLQLRKRNNYLIYTTQHIKQVDIRLRNLTDYIFYCFKRNWGFKIFVFDGYQYFLITTLKLLKSDLMKYKIFDIYNTFEVVKKIEVPEVKV
jgi:hypothetical protein